MATAATGGAAASAAVSTLERKCVDTVRLLAADMVEKANSGHPGEPPLPAPARAMAAIPVRPRLCGGIHCFALRVAALW